MSFLGELLTKIKEGLGVASWIEIKTAQPECVYYFGPFGSESEAERHKASYIADLQNEGAQGIQVVIKQGPKPEALTVESVPASR